MTYLDHAAATPLDPKVFETMKPWMTEKYGNPSSIHRLGQEALAAVDKARMQVASFLNCQPTEVFFTSSGTESCNWALLGTVERQLLKGKQVHLIISAIEHSAVLETARFLERSYGVAVDYLPVTAEGILEIPVLEASLRPETVLVSVMMVNNEIGTLQPVEEMAQLCQERGVLFHTDACQAAAYFDLDLKKLEADLLSINASKIYGPKGVGVLFIREGTDISPWTFGGGQEFKMRAGTENVPAIVGMGAAVSLVKREMGNSLQTLRDQLWKQLEKNIDGIDVNGSLENSTPHILNIFIPDIDGETLVKRLDLEGFAVSTGSACTSGTIEPSHVILALGYDEARARSSIRISLGKESTAEEIHSFGDTLAKLVLQLHQ